MLDAAKYVNLCNDDTVTFSTTYTDMKQNATYWLSHLPPFNQNTFAIVQGTNEQRIPHICVFVLHNDRIVIIPIVLNVLFVLYKAYPNNTPIYLLYTNTLDKARDQLRSILSVTDVNCKQQNRYPNFEPFVDYFIKDSEAGVRLSPTKKKLKPSTINSFKTTRKKMSAFFNSKGWDLKIWEVTQEHIDMLSDHLILDLEWSMNTHAKFMMDLLQVFKYAVKLKKLPPSILTELKFDY
jgi:hypothetical protein